MSKEYFKVQQRVCEECSLALRRFIGGMDGINSVTVEVGSVAVEFDEETISSDRVRQLVRDSMDRLGYGVEEY